MDITWLHGVACIVIMLQRNILTLAAPPSRKDGAAKRSRNNLHLHDRNAFFWDAMMPGKERFKVKKENIQAFLKDFEFPTFQGSAAVQDFVLWKSSRKVKVKPLMDVNWIPDATLDTLGSKVKAKKKQKQRAAPKQRLIDINWIPDATLGHLGQQFKLKQIFSRAKEHGPCVGMDCLHGVMMHSKMTEGQDIHTEHEQLRKKRQHPNYQEFGPSSQEAMAEVPPKELGPLEEPCAKGVCSHEKHKKLKDADEWIDPEEVLHSDGKGHSHENVDHHQNQTGISGTEGASEVEQLEMMLHGMDHDVHKDKVPETGSPNIDSGPFLEDLEKAVHGSASEKVHDGKENHVKTKRKLSVALNPEEFLNGEYDAYGKLTQKELEEAKARPKPVFGVVDPHEIIHGDHNILGEGTHSHEVVNNDVKLQNKGTISKSPLNMKLQYLTQFVSNLFKASRDPNHLARKDNEEDEDDGVIIEDDDMRHEVEKIGQTGPLDSHDEAILQRRQEQKSTADHPHVQDP